MTAALTIRDFQLGDEVAFRALNEAWIRRFFVLEERDHQILGDPIEHILRPGGAILMAELNGRMVGCCALAPHGTGGLELGKMAVAENTQRQGIGEKLMRAAIERARVLGARHIYLETNSRLAPALRLYARTGFRIIDNTEAPPSPYARADLRMQREL